MGCSSCVYLNLGGFDYPCNVCKNHSHWSDEIPENETDKNRIKSEINRLIKGISGWNSDYLDGYKSALEEILEFIDKM